MSLKLQITLRRFDAKMDYLPYETQVKIVATSPAKEGLLELYGYIKAQIPDFGFDPQTPFCRIAGRIVHQNITIESLVQRFGMSFTLESLSSRATLKDLIIDTTPYFKALDSLEAIIALEPEEREHYRTLLPFHYLAPRELEEAGYLGEAYFLFVAYLMERHPKESTSLLALLSDPLTGVMNATPWSERIFPATPALEAKIEKLQASLIQGYPYQESRWVKWGKELFDSKLQGVK